MEPRNIVDDDPQERVSAEAAILNSRVHYYSRLTGSSDRLLVGRPSTTALLLVLNLFSLGESRCVLLPWNRLAFSP